MRHEINKFAFLLGNWCTGKNLESTFVNKCGNYDGRFSIKSIWRLYKGYLQPCSKYSLPKPNRFYYYYRSIWPKPNIFYYYYRSIWPKPSLLILKEIDERVDKVYRPEYRFY